MKKIVTVILVCFCFSPAFAQGEKTAAEIATGKVGAEITRQMQAATSQAARVEQMVRSMDFGAALHYTDHAMQLSELEAARVPEVADLSAASNVQNTLENASKESLHLQEKLANLKRVIWKKRATKLFSPAAPQVRLAQITNLPGQPTVRLRLDSKMSFPTTLHGGVLYSDEVFNHTNFIALGQLYVPRIFSTEKNVWYRGMSLSTLTDLENILTSGLEISKTRAWVTSEAQEGIYITPYLPVALGYAVPAQYTRQEISEQKTFFFPSAYRLGAAYLPTLVSIPIGLIDDTEKTIYSMAVDEYAFPSDIPYSAISHIAVFLEINGKPDWYEAVIENNELVLEQMPSILMDGYMGSMNQGYKK